MKLGLFTNCFRDETWEEICSFAGEVGFSVLEVAAGALNGKKHCNPSELLKDNYDIKRFVDTANKHGLEISSLSCMGNYLHPNRQIAEKNTADLEAAIDLASKIGVKVVNGFAGCPGAQEDALYPNWIGLPYPPEYIEYSKWQWKERIIPFWKKMNEKLRKYKIRFGFEMLPGDSVYNTGTLLRIRNIIGEYIGCCFDPTHLFWQQIDPIESIFKLGDVIVNVHAQDCILNKRKIRVDGVLDPTSYEDYENRSWHFKLVGYGHGESFWKEMMSALRRTGYDDSINLEHLDPLFSLKEGLLKGKEFLDRVIFKESKGEIRY